jgi:Tol biopolymer transport system component
MEEKIMKTTGAIRLFAVTILAALLTAPSVIAQKDDQADVLMQAAHQKQLVEGQLEEAIQLYKRIVQEHSGNHAVAAQALLEMGQCYEKLGNVEARKAYERLLSDYGEQNEAAAQARARLAALSGKPASGGSEMLTRRVWAGSGDGEFIGGSLSADGRYLSCVDWATGDLALRDLVTGKMRHLINKTESGDYAFLSTISPDGKEVAYIWFGKDGPDLRLVRWDGSAPRVLYANKGVYPLPTDWSPDGKYILTLLLKEPNTYQIGVISVVDGSVRVLKTLDSYSLKVTFSPDGRYIAYDGPQQEDSDNRDIFLLAADGSREIRLVEHPADDQLLGWTPDGNHILFASDRSGTMSAWLLRVSDGKPQGPPELVKQDIGQAQPIGFTRTGSFYYGLVIGTSDVYTAEFDPATGRVVTQAQKTVQRFIGSNFSPAWSPDGQFLAYLSSRRPGVMGHRPEVISIRSLKTGEERDLPPKLGFIWGPIRWSPNGRSILVPGKDRKIQHGLFLVDAQTGEVTPALWWGDSEISNPAWLPDGKRLLYNQSHRESGTIRESILVRDLQTGRSTELFRAAPGAIIDDIALSPDGQQVALTLLEKRNKSSVLKLLPVTGGETSELVRAKEPEVIVGDSLSWSSDSRYILFGRAQTTSQELQGSFPSGPKTQLFAIPSRGGEPHPLGLAMDSAHSFSFDPTGHHIAFAAGRAKSEIWVMENFLPSLKAARRR